MADTGTKKSSEFSTEKLTTHEELQRSYQILTKLINNIDVSNSEWITELFEELNDPTKVNLMSKISNNDEPTELIDTLSTMHKDDNDVQQEMDDQLFDPSQLQKDLLNVVSLVETAKLKGNKRMDVLFAGFQALKQTQSSLITKTINQYIVDTNLHRLDSKITEMDQLVTKLKTSVAEKRFVFNQRKADANLSAEDLRHKYEMDVEDTIRGLVITIDRDKQELTRVEERQALAVSGIDQMKADLSVLLHEIDREEKDRLVKDFNPVQFFYDINSITSSGQTDGDGSTLITQQAVDESFRMLEAVSLDNTAILDRIALAEEEAKGRRADLSAVLKREDNKALERLKKMTGGLESKIDNDRKRIALLELIVRQIDKDALDRPAHETSVEAFGGHIPSANRNTMRTQHQSGVVVQSNHSQLSGLLAGGEGDHGETAASAVHRNLYSKYKAAVPVAVQEVFASANDHSGYYARSEVESWVEQPLAAQTRDHQAENISRGVQQSVQLVAATNQSAVLGEINTAISSEKQSNYRPVSNHTTRNHKSFAVNRNDSNTSGNRQTDVESERAVRWDDGQQHTLSSSESRGGMVHRADATVDDGVSQSVVGQPRSPAIAVRQSYISNSSTNTHASHGEHAIRTKSTSPNRPSVSAGRTHASAQSPTRGALVSASPAASVTSSVVRRAIPTGQVNRMQQAIDMFDHERNRIVMAGSSWPGDGFDYGDSSQHSSGDSRHILTYSMPAGVHLAPDSRLAESIAEQMVSSGQVAPLSRSSLLMHNSGMPKHQTNSIANKRTSANPQGGSMARQGGVQPKDEQTDRDEALDEGSGTMAAEAEVADLLPSKTSNRQSVILRHKHQQMPSRDAFSAEQFFKSGVAVVDGDKMTAELVDKPISSAPKAPAFRMFDATKAVIEGQESEASEYYMRTFGYQTALEQLNTLMNILTNYNSNHVSAVDGQVTFSRTAEEELESVEALRHQITSYVQRIKHAYRESHNVHAILKDIQSELSREAREIEVARSGLLRAIEGVKWPHYLKPGEYQSEAEACKARIRELRQEARAWESKVHKKRRANMRLSTLLTSDQGANSSGGSGAGKAQLFRPQQQQQRSQQQQYQQSQPVDRDKQPLSQEHLSAEQSKSRAHRLGGQRPDHAGQELSASLPTKQDVSYRSADKRDEGGSFSGEGQLASTAARKAGNESQGSASRTGHSNTTVNTSREQNVNHSSTSSEHDAAGAPRPRDGMRSNDATQSVSRARRPADRAVGENSTVISATSRSGRRPPRNVHPTKPASRDILRHPEHHSAETDRPSSGQYSVSNNRLAIFNDITDIYDNTLKAFRAAAATHTPLAPPLHSALPLPAELDPSAVPSSSLSPAAALTSGGNVGEMTLGGNSGEEEDEDEEDGESLKEAPLVHFVPPDLFVKTD